MTEVEAVSDLMKCCGSIRWAERLADELPFNDFSQLIAESDKVWCSLDEQDWREAFSHHPMVGGDEAESRQSPEAKRWSEGEQSGARTASRAISDELAELNRAYKRKFGYIFIICATGKSGEEILTALRERLQNTPEAEIKIAAEEQLKITRLRLEKLLRT